MLKLTSPIKKAELIKFGRCEKMSRKSWKNKDNRILFTINVYPCLPMLDERFCQLILTRLSKVRKSANADESPERIKEGPNTRDRSVRAPTKDHVPHAVLFSTKASGSFFGLALPVVKVRD